MYRCIFLSGAIKLIARILPLIWPNGSFELNAVSVINMG